MKFTILTLFPDMIEPFVHGSILGRAQTDGKIQIELRNLRDWAMDKHKTVDDTPYGGGAGMVLRVDVIDRALADLKAQNSNLDVILLTPQGQRFTQEVAEHLAESSRDILLIAGHYEGFDERIRSLVDRQLSLGDFVLTGGEIAAAAIVDAVARLVPGVLAEGSATEESFSLMTSPANNTRLLEYPHYTRPEVYTPQSKHLGELVVPEILKSGDHARIAAWRHDQSVHRTKSASR